MRKIIKNYKKYGLDRERLDKMLKLELLRIQIGFTSPLGSRVPSAYNWEYILKTIRVLNANHSGRVRLELRSHLDGG